jgi:hypothetical protein
LTFYRISSQRGSLLSGVRGIVVHDHWKPYYLMTGVLHALCNAHHLRDHLDGLHRGSSQCIHVEEPHTTPCFSVWED